MIARLCALIVTALAVLTGADALAHPQKEAQTEVLFNPRTGAIEVAHRFSLHDAEYAIRDELGLTGDLYTDLQTQGVFADYVAARFTLSGTDGTALPLTYLGSEIAEGYLWIYQEVAAPDTNAEPDSGTRFDTIPALSIRADALRDVWPEQVNRVNVVRGGMVRTLIFSQEAGSLTATFDD